MPSRLLGPAQAEVTKKMRWRFDVVAFLSIADPAHRAAFLAWAKNPVCP